VPVIVGGRGSAAARPLAVTRPTFLSLSRPSSRGGQPTTSVGVPANRASAAHRFGRLYLLIVQARRIALGDCTPVIANLGNDRYHPGSLASAERPVLVVHWGLLSADSGVALSVSPARGERRMLELTIITTRARCFLRCIPSQVCFEPLTRTRLPTTNSSYCRTMPRD
jgi:hypothetical protein